MRYQNLYQYALIGCAMLVVFGIGAFVYYELFPEYRKYQDVYEELEKIRSTYTHEKPAPFSKGIKQIFIPNPTGGPELIDRCISCHVALDLPHFSPTRTVLDEKGNQIAEPNPDYVWALKDKRIEELRKTPALEKAIQMHPLLPGESRPFQLHPMAEYGCTSCHSGNGRSLVAKRAHGPAYDDDYNPFYSTPKPQFTEVDPENDPPFSRMYNNKPEHELAFQTTPILAGPLMVANCVQCHQTPSHDSQQHKASEKLTANYQRGKELFVSQACYACHRIAGYSRSSVGPELTHEGNSYPWYVKESIVWPQANLPSSTMPNFRLDHDELAALMTFLMAQRGKTKAISEMDYRIEISQWEKGAKMPWEQPVAPTKIENVRAGQLVFATEGCAACHKLQGFESNAYFKDEVEDRAWFYRLFPEQIPGSHLAYLVTKHAQEIDKRILIDKGRHGVIEEIEHQFPGLIEGFYTNFKFANRATTETERLRRVFLMYIQEYGLGRNIAPHLNWSGIYRDDAWLLGHFHNPPEYSAKSIMPVMPFDDSKFYMLNYMLHELGKKNRDAIQEIWRAQGFNPALAYKLLCSSCHGSERRGNGMIAEWIYPLPKNLRNPVFLNSLTKERAIQSITHGVPGTPMAPWGEAIDLVEKEPVLNTTQIKQLVDWLYQGVPESPRTETLQKSAKWQYTPLDAVQEMEKEKKFLQPIPASTTKTVDEYFSQEPNLIGGPDKELYYIRDKYYTPHNLEEGKQFFMVNCATCHGKEGNGAGLRSTSMVEAKPRSFTNQPWISDQDDLQLLRSIKYGVPGTAMTPWGDQTTAEQRMQLVMFIREFTQSNLPQINFEETLYTAFDHPIQIIEQARVPEYRQLENLKTDWQKTQEDLLTLAKQEKASDEQISSLYAQSVKLEKQYAKAQAEDAIYQQLIQSIRDEKEIYSNLGSQAKTSNFPEEMTRLLFKLIKEQPLSYSLENGKLKWEENPPSSTEAALLQALDAYISSTQHRIDVEKGKIFTEEVHKNLDKISAEQAIYANFKSRLINQLAAAATLRQQQKELLNKI